MLTSEHRVDVVVVNWNGRRFLPECLRAVRRSRLPVRVVVVDNASDDGSAELVSSDFPEVRLLALDENRGYAAGANAGLALGEARHVLVMNPDVLLSPDYLPRIVERMEEDSRIGAAQGRLFAVEPDDFRPDRVRPSGSLDSAGHVIRRSRMVVDRGQGEPDGAEFREEVSVFSACGAALVLRRELVDELGSTAAPGEGPFSDGFFAYKEDIDLCWRARLLGWDIRYLPDAAAWHVRGWPGSGPRRGGPPRGGARRHSWKNHYLLMLRNDRLADWLRHLPWILGWEILRIGHLVLRDPGLVLSYGRLVRAVPGALRARRRIGEARRVDPSGFRRWFGGGTRAPGTVDR